MDTSSQQDVSIIDKDESSEKAYHVIDGFVIEDSKSPFPNGQLSFVPEDYGKVEKPHPVKRSKSSTGAPHSSPALPAEDLPPGMCRCEFCRVVGERDQFVAPSRRFCSVTCCKRYSAEKRYYPYGRDEEGIAQSIREGLLNPNRSSRLLRPGASKQAHSIREQRRRRLAYFGSPQGAGPSRERTGGKGRGRRGKRGRPSSSPAQVKLERQSSYNSSLLEPYFHPCGTPLHEWSVEDVGEFLTSLGYEAYLDKFVEHEIDGRALSLVKDHHLLMTMKLRLGPTLKIIENVSAIKAIEEIMDDA